MPRTMSTPTERQAAVAELLASGRWTEAEIQKLAARLSCSRRTLYNDRARLREPARPIVQLAPRAAPLEPSIDLASAELVEVYAWLLQRLVGEVEAGEIRDTARVAAYREIRSLAAELHQLRKVERVPTATPEELEARFRELMARLPRRLRRSVSWDAAH